MSRGNSIERARMMRALGAEVVLVDQLADSVPGQVSGGDLEEVERVTRQLVQERNAFRADQFENLSNCMSHHDQTAAEIWEQTNGMVTAFCDFAGTGGSWAGCTKYFREQNAAIRCYLIEPEGAAALKGECVTKPGHRIQGGGYARQTLTQIAGVAPDGFLTVSDDEAIATTRLLARKEGLFCGFSSGANVAAALQLLRGPCRGGTIAVLLCDSGLKYISTDLWD
jgi:cysteine synthase A